MDGFHERSARTLELIRRLAPSPPAVIDPRWRLADAGFDSLAFVELASVVDEELGVDLEGAMVGEQSLVADVIEAVERASAPRAGGGAPRHLGRLQRPAKLFSGPVLRWWLALHVEGTEHVPVNGPAILAMNHESALDIPLVVVACPRPITFMAKRELFTGPVISRSLHELGGFRVDRERFDLRAVRVGLDALLHGDVLGMYPEGTRAPGRLLPFLRGAAWMALRTGSPLVPIGILGTERAGRARLPRRVRVDVRFGEPILVEPTGDPDRRRREAGRISEELRSRVQGLLGFPTLS
jgi:1-acyl-sn-glycerol-3-phosphate acyltransferase